MTKQANHPLTLETTRNEGDLNSFTRFVVPFAWRRETISAPGDASPYYREIDQATNGFDARRKYFTHETGKVLYKKAKWLELAGFAQNKYQWARGGDIHLQDGRCIQAKMKPPRVVLFEWSGNHENNLLQTGFLVVDICLLPKGENVPILDDLLTFNELFRSTDQPYKLLDEKFREHLQQARWSFLDREHRDYTKRWLELLALPAQIDGQWYRLIGFSAEEENAGSVLDIYADNRGYVWSAAILEKGMAGLQTLARGTSFLPEDYGHWIRLLNVDSASDCPSKTHREVSGYEKQWAAERTYKRWIHYGTWYGFSYHSGVMLSGPGKFATDFATFYFDIVLLLFYIRVSLFRFSNRLTDLADRLLNADEKLREEFTQLRKDFARFTILYQFPLLSNQQQAIEMYNLARNHFDIEAFHNEVKDEIQETHAFLDMEQNKKLNESATRISYWGIPFATAAVVTGILGMNINDFNFYRCWLTGDPLCNGVNWEAIILVLIVLGVTALFWFVTWLYLKKIEDSGRCYIVEPQPNRKPKK